jgi:hypothetical protein
MFFIYVLAIFQHINHSYPHWKISTIEQLKISSVDVAEVRQQQRPRKRSISPSWGLSRMDIGLVAKKRCREWGDLNFCGE